MTISDPTQLRSVWDSIKKKRYSDFTFLEEQLLKSNLKAMVEAGFLDLPKKDKDNIWESCKANIKESEYDSREKYLQARNDSYTVIFFKQWQKMK